MAGLTSADAKVRGRIKDMGEASRPTMRPRLKLRVESVERAIPRNKSEKQEERVRERADRARKVKAVM